MANIISNVHERFKTSTNVMALVAFKLFSGSMLGLTMALIGQEIIQYGVLSFLLVAVVVAACLMKVAKAWSWTHILIFDLICVLIGLLLHMYILIAPSV
jgi:hypothetical protein